MCGRYVTKDQADIERFWHVGRQTSNPLLFRGRFNAAPTQKLPVIRIETEGDRALALLRWGLIPSWAKDTKKGGSFVLARGETAAVKPAFRAAFRRRRCLVPMAGYYEWQQTSTGKLPHYIQLLNAEQFAVAGLYEYWPGKEGAEPIESYAIITTSANQMAAKIHDRMPVIIPEHHHDEWLDPKYGQTEALQKLLIPYPTDEMRAIRVGIRVNSVKNDGPELIEPA